MKRAAALVVLALSLAASPLAVTTGGGTEKTGPGTWALYTPSEVPWRDGPESLPAGADRKSTRLNSSHRTISYAVFCLKKKTQRRLYCRRHGRRAGHPAGPRPHHAPGGVA